MITGNYKEVYVTQDSIEIYGFKVWDPNIGIVKYRGCVEFRSARSLGKDGRINRFKYTGKLDDRCACRCCENNRGDIRRAFGFIPKPGTAWIVNTTTLKRKRVDKDMALIDPDTGKVIK